MHHIFGMRSDGAEDSEYRLHEEGRLHETPVGEMREVVQVPDVVALELDVPLPCRSREYDILERVPEDRSGGLGAASPNRIEGRISRRMVRPG
jgi:hypothetical protein